MKIIFKIQLFLSSSFLVVIVAEVTQKSKGVGYEI